MKKNKIIQFSLVMVGIILLFFTYYSSNKDEIVDGLTKGIEQLFKKNKISYFKGTGVVSGKGQVAVKGEKGKAENTYSCKKRIKSTTEQTIYV